MPFPCRRPVLQPALADLLLPLIKQRWRYAMLPGRYRLVDCFAVYVGYQFPFKFFRKNTNASSAVRCPARFLAWLSDRYPISCPIISNRLLKKSGYCLQGEQKFI